MLQNTKYLQNRVDNSSTRSEKFGTRGLGGATSSTCIERFANMGAMNHSGTALTRAKVVTTLERITTIWKPG
ncbi:hypothetical protein K443DRAFT_684556, partial [Laccaria amethystina LaAM-08-1]